MTALVAYMNGALGRGLRLLLGIGLIGYRTVVVRGGTGAVVAVIGLLPIGLGCGDTACSSRLCHAATSPGNAKEEVRSHE